MTDTYSQPVGIVVTASMLSSMTPMESKEYKMIRPAEKYILNPNRTTPKAIRTSEGVNNNNNK